MQHDQPLKTNGIMSLTGKLEDHHVKHISQIQREKYHVFTLRGGWIKEVNYLECQRERKDKEG